MCKKIGIAAVAVAVVLFLLNSTMLGSYTSTAFSKIHGSFKKQVPIEFEIDRIKHEIAQLVPDMKKNLSSVAEEMVAIDNLKEDIRVTRERLATEKVSIMTMTEDLDKGATVVNYKGRDYSATRVREKLASAFEHGGGQFAGRRVLVGRVVGRQQGDTVRQLVLGGMPKDVSGVAAQHASALQVGKIGVEGDFA